MTHGSECFSGPQPWHDGVQLVFSITTAAVTPRRRARGDTGRRVGSIDPGRARTWRGGGVTTSREPGLVDLREPPSSSSAGVPSIRQWSAVSVLQTPRMTSPIGSPLCKGPTQRVLCREFSSGAPGLDGVAH